MADARKVNEDSTHETDERSRTIEGVEFSPADSVWRIATAHGPAVFNFNNLPGVSETMRSSFKEAFAALLLSNAPERLANHLSRLRALLRYLNATHPGRSIDELTVADIQNYGAALPIARKYWLQKVKEILLSWGSTGVGGLSDDLRLFLPTLETTSHEIGAAVRTMDPYEGPLTDIEYEAVVAAIRKSFAVGTLTLADYVLLLLAITIGMRSLQLSMLKVNDLNVTDRADGSRIYILQVTRLKQGKNIRPRTLFRPRQLTPALGAMVEQQAAQSRAWAVVHGIPAEDAPLFPSTSRAPQHRRAVLPDLLGHRDSKGTSEKISRLLAKLEVRSHRIDGAIRIFQTRLRRTFGSRVILPPYNRTQPSV